MDFATLSIGADTSELRQAERALDDLVASGARAEGATNKVGGSLTGAGRAASSAANDNNIYERSLREMTGSLGEADQASGAFAGGLGRIATALAGVVAAGAGLAQIISINQEFGASMSQVAAVSGATGLELEKLRQTAIQMGSDTAFSATEAADALGLLAQAGLSASQAMEAVPQVLSLAAAGGLGLAAAADITTKAMAGFGLAASEAGRIADVLATGAAVSNASVQQLGDAMVVAGPIARELGITLEETAAAVSVLADAGLQGEMGGTALRGVFASLVSPTKEAGDAIKSLGVSLAEVNPQAVGISAAMATLSEAGITTADAFTIFGREAATGALVLASAAERTDELVGSFQNATGAAEEMASVMRDNLAGDIDGLTGSIETMIITLGDAGVTGALRAMAQTATSAINFLSENMNALIVIVGAAAGGLTAYGVVLAATTFAQSAFGAVVLTATAQLGVMAGAQVALAGATAFATTATRSLTAALVANPFTAVAVAVGVLAGAFIALRNAQAEARAETNNLISSLKALSAGRAADYLGERTKAVQTLFERQNELYKLEQRLAALPDAQRKFAIEGNSALVVSIKELRGEVVKLDTAIEQGDAANRRATEAMRQVAVPAAVAADRISDVGTAARGTTKAVEELAEALPKAFTDALARQMFLVDSNMDAIIARTGEATRFANQQAEAQDRASKAHRARIYELGIEYNMLGRSNAERETASLMLEREAYVLEYGTQAWEEYRAARQKIIDQQAAMEREAQLIGELAGAFEGLAGLIGGRAGRALGGLLSMEVMVNDESGERVSRRMSDILSKTLIDAFGQGAEKLTGAISAAFEGAQAGKEVNGLLNSLGIKSNNTGAQIGGAVGSSIGMAVGGPAGAQIGAISGSIWGGIIGGIVVGTKRASATVSVIAGEAVQTAMQGNSKKLKGIATELANGLIGGLQNIAAQFGGQIGNFGAISIGTRNDTFRVDPTGQGRTKNLQQFATEEEAIKEALRIAISRGAITGIRAGTDALLRMQGDLETNLQKALAFEDVFARVAKETDPLNYALGQLEKEFNVLRDIFAQAKASTADLLVLDQLYNIERTKILEQYTQTVDENGNAVEAATEALRERTGLEIRLLELQGNTVAALALSRQAELDALDPSNRAIAQQIFALEDQAEAARIAAEAADALAQAEAAIAQERFALESRLLGLQGNVAALRERELAALDPSNRAILANIFALEDQAAANQAAADAAAELARVQEQVAQERFNIEGQILQLLGNTAALRERELALADPSNRALLQRLFAIEDEQIAMEAAAQAASDLAAEQERLAGEQLRITQELAAAQARILEERLSLETRLLQLQGNTAELRRRELDALDPTNRAILEQIFALEDLRNATGGVTEATRSLADIANERAGLERQILELLGNTAAIRELELAALDPSNRALQERIYALQDEATAVAAATRASQEFARAQQAIADEVTGLQRQLLEAQGNTSAIRELELAALLSEEARAIQRELYRLEDAANAVSASQDRGTRAADELADAERRIAEERMGLTIRLLEAQGNATAALNLRRKQELDALDPSNRALLRQIYVLEDYKEALDAAKSALEQSVDAERRAIEDRLSPLRSELERLVSAVTPDAPDIAAALQVQDFLGEGLDIARRLSEASRNVLGDTESVVAMQRDMARRELFRMAETRRINGDIIDQLISDATRFGDDFANPVDLLREQALTANVLADLARIQEEQAIASQAIEDARAEDARSAVMAQISALQAQIAIEEASLASLDAILDRFGLLNDGVLSVRDAVNNLVALVGGPNPVTTMGPSGGVPTSAPAAVAQRETMEATNAELVKNNEYLRELVRSALKRERSLKEVGFNTEGVLVQ